MPESARRSKKAAPKKKAAPPQYTTVFGEALEPRHFEARALGALLAWQRREGRRDPLGPGVVLEVIERMRAEAHDVRLVSSATDLGAPPGMVAAALVTPA